MNLLRPPVTVNIENYAEMIPVTLSEEQLELIKYLPKFFTKKLSVVVDFFKSENTSIAEYDIKKFNIYAKELSKNKYALNKARSKLNYSLVSRRISPVFVGLNVDVMLLSKVLTSSNAIIKDNLSGMLSETSEIIARLVSDKDFRLSSRPIVMDKKYTKAVALLESNINKILDPKNIKDTRTVAELMPSIPHLEEAVALALDYSGNNNMDRYKQINEEVDRISKYSDTLYSEFNNKEINISKKRIYEIAKYLNVAANFVTQSINTLYLSNQSVVVLNGLIEVVLKKGIKRK